MPLLKGVLSASLEPFVTTEKGSCDKCHCISLGYHFGMLHNRLTTHTNIVENDPHIVQGAGGALLQPFLQQLWQATYSIVFKI